MDGLDDRGIYAESMIFCTYEEAVPRLVEIMDRKIEYLNDMVSQFRDYTMGIQVSMDGREKQGGDGT